VRTTLLGIAAAAVLCGGGWAVAGRGVLAQARPASGESCTLAVLRRDGVLVPFASLDGGRWTNRWPEPGRRVDIPITIDESPKNWWLRDRPVATWNAWPIGRDSFAVHVKNPVNFTAECERHLGLETDYASMLPRVPPDMQPYPKDGLATSGDIPIEPIEILNSTWTDWQKVVTAVTAPFDAAEAKLVARSGNPRVHLLSESRRARTPVSLEMLFRSPGVKPGTSVLYFEAVKRYGADRPRSVPGAPGIHVSAGRDPLFFAAGWGTMDAERKVKLSVTVDVSDTDREGLLYAFPLGRFSAGGRQYWALQRSGWGFEQYEVWTLDEPEPRLAFKTSGGMCR
jgi:hypothetical protein